MTTISTDRQELGKVLPLDTPFTCMVFPSNICNFRCIYCSQSTKPSTVKNQMMSWEIYKKTIDDLTRFPSKLRLLVLAGLGEPLIHPQISDMVAYAKEKQAAHTVRIITNASLLSPEKSDALIDAGLDHLKISIQGVTEEAHQKWGGKPAISLARIVENITYFYNHKKDTIVNVKIVADAFENSDDERKFYELFEPICDVMNIEHVEKIMENVDYSAIGVDSSVGITGNTSEGNCICQMPFYYLSVYPDGEITPCCTSMFENYKAISFGNVLDVDLDQIWNGEKMNRFRLKLLRKEREQIPVCATCFNFQAQCRPEDNIDPYAQRLIEIYQKLGKK